ncbi:DNA polymerase epsilon subunit 2 [Anabrus simplex]|uniref:DNA polymerase epsilon subunit 2 n=1 Tax=Anabrus simplex TaxID=316456 RepID=UPI0035A33302
MAEVKLRKLVLSTFRLNGFSLIAEACDFLVSQLLPLEASEREEWLDKIIEHVQKLPLASPTINRAQVEQAIHECVRSGQDVTETVLNVISAFEVPRFRFNPERKKFLKVLDSKDAPAPEIFHSPDAKGSLYRDRYTILFQRTSRHELFAPTLLADTDKVARRYTLQPIEYFLSAPDKVTNATVLGLLTELREGCFYLEDPTGTLQLDLSETRYHTGLYIENCYVLVEGWYDDKVFHVEGMGFPPPEASKTSRAYFGNVNTFGGPSAASLRSSTKLIKYEKENEDEMIVFLSDVWLDNFKVVSKLRTLFQGYSEFPPVAFVLMGNFLSAEYGALRSQMLKSKLSALGDIICEFPELAQKSKFIFIPGPTDPAAPKILPRPPIPKTITDDFQKKVPTSIFATNPCRIQYCTQEIVVIREDLVTKMCRNTIHFPTSGEIAEHFAKTILCQAHLAPMPLAVCPVYWAFDTALQLYPLPDLVVTGDQFCAFSTCYMDCQVVNPGSFPKSEFSFKVYIPALRQMEDSQIAKDSDETT